MERRIRELCTQLLATEEPAEFHALAAQFRQALHTHIEQMRYRASQLALANQLLLESQPPAE